MTKRNISCQKLCYNNDISNDGIVNSSIVNYSVFNNGIFYSKIFNGRMIRGRYMRKKIIAAVLVLAVAAAAAAGFHARRSAKQETSDASIVSGTDSVSKSTKSTAGGKKDIEDISVISGSGSAETAETAEDGSGENTDPSDGMVSEPTDTTDISDPEMTPNEAYNIWQNIPDNEYAISVVYDELCAFLEENGLKKRPSGVSGAKKELSYENLSDEGMTLDELKQKVKEDVERYGGTEYWIGISIEENRININLF